jgi:hypothetical protein
VSVELHFEGFIKDVVYKAFLTKDLPRYDYRDFNINNTESCGILSLPSGEIAFSKWVSPKRSRSFPFEGLYNIYNSPNRMTVIPVIKDEGLDGDLDRLQYSTISWMNLLNIFIVLSYYDQAIKNNRPQRRGENTLTNQKLDEKQVGELISRITNYKQCALHWNRTLFEESWDQVFEAALDSYKRISQETGVEVHDRQTQEEYRDSVRQSYEAFRDISLKASKSASMREIQTIHRLEYLCDGNKATIEINNLLGGTYHLTADEIVEEGKNTYIIQESKNSSKGFLPKLPDIKDGLFKLILFANLHSLKLESVPVNFRTRLKLTGKKVKESLSLPCDDVSIRKFLNLNQGNYSSTEADVICKLNLEASNNKRLEILMTSN